MLYDTIGLDYANLRQPDPRIARQLNHALASAQSVLNVGAGAGSYEPTGRSITAVEPSAEMLRQRPGNNGTALRAVAEQLPFQDNAFDASMAILTIHHWTDKTRGVQEMLRVTTGQVVFLTYDPAFRNFWLLDYFPELISLDEAQMPSMARYKNWLGACEVSVVPIPHDCTDGFLAAYWRRPAAYLDQRVRAAMSPFWALDDIAPGLHRLETDLGNGEWVRRYGHLLTLDNIDCGYRMIKSL